MVETNVKSTALRGRKIIDSNTHFLEGPNSRGKEFVFSISSAWQLIKGFRKLHFVGPCVTVFGSARLDDQHPHYKMAQEVGRLISEVGLTVMTGGGPGIMEAANRGAFESGGKSVGCTIKLPKEQSVNPYMQSWVEVDFFFVRKVLLLKYSYAFVVMPGGFGTLDELFETLTLIQTSILNNFPVVVIGKEFYKDIISLIQNMEAAETISPEDQELLLFTDDPVEALSHIMKFISDNYQIKSKKTKRRWWLGE